MKNIKQLFRICLLVLALGSIPAAHAGMTQIPKPHRIIFQLVSGDTNAHKALMKQLQNISSVAPDTRMEVVCHGPGLNMLTTQSIVAEKLQTLMGKGIVFNACEFSMQERKVDKAQILPGVGYVKAGILEIVEKQEQGWNYIKAGF